MKNNLLMLYSLAIMLLLSFNSNAQSAGFGVVNCNNLTAQVNPSPTDDGYLIVLSQTPIEFTPVDQLSYTFSLVYGLSADVSPLADGEYVVYNGVVDPTITGLVNNSTYYYKVFFYVLVNGAPVYSLSSEYDGVYTIPPVLNLSTQANHVTCNGAADGSIDLTILNGNSPFSFLFDSVATTVTNSTLPNQNFGPLTPGTYLIGVMDAIGCVSQLPSTIMEPDTLEIGLVSMNDVDCFGGDNGNVEFFVNTGALSGSVLTYSFDTNLNIDTNTVTGLYEINNIPAGTHDVVVFQDGNPVCSDTITFNIGQPNALSVNITDLIEPLCGGGNNGEIRAEVLGGTMPYSIEWTNQAGSTIGFGNMQSNLIAGDYAISIEDANNCSIDTLIMLNEDIVGCLRPENIPNVFTPNGDSANDTWNIQGLLNSYPNNKVIICNRWGDPVYEKAACADNCWDGIANLSNEELPTGTYFYIIQLDSNAEATEDNVFKGTLNLLR